SAMKPEIFGVMDDPDSGFKQKQASVRRKALISSEKILQSLLQPGEEIGYALTAVGAPPTLDRVGLGNFWMHYHRVLLVFTKLRIIEIELDGSHVRAGRVRSIPWAQVRSILPRSVIMKGLQVKTRNPAKTIGYTLDGGGYDLLKKLAE